MLSSGGKFSDENYFTIMKKVKLLRSQTDYDSRASFQLRGGEKSYEQEKGDLHIMQCAKGLSYGNGYQPASQVSASLSLDRPE